ncbi:MAG: T9SS type A sorting domain-containing protein [Flavitalea sp.]
MHQLLTLGRTSFILLICLVFSMQVFCQARMVLNGATVTIANSAVLVIENGHANALTRTGGYIVSEGENNSIKWVIGSHSGSYIVPWGNNTSGYLPVSFTTSSATGNGNFIFSTYPTAWQNSLELPTGVTNLSRNGSDNSAYVLDRFWKIRAEDYIAKPAISNLIFTFADIEHTEPDNTINEISLVAQEWNDNSLSWEDIPPSGTVNTSTNTVTIPAVAPVDLFTWWTLIDANVILPLQFLSFDLTMQNSDAILTWTTADEVNVRDFSVQKRSNGESYLTIATLNAVGGPGPHKYSFTDRQVKSGRTEYRIQEKDFDGRIHYSKIKSVLVESPAGVTIYPNPLKGKSFFIGGINLPTGNYVLTLYDAGGSIFLSQHKKVEGKLLQVELAQRPPKGTYFLRITGKGLSTTGMLIVD